MRRSRKMMIFFPGRTSAYVIDRFIPLIGVAIKPRHSTLTSSSCPTDLRALPLQFPPHTRHPTHFRTWPLVPGTSSQPNSNCTPSAFSSQKALRPSQKLAARHMRCVFQLYSGYVSNQHLSPAHSSPIYPTEHHSEQL